MVEDFIKRLNLCCKEKGMTRTEWARDFGIPEATIRNWIRRGNMPSAEIIYNIAKYFGVPIEYLLDGKEYPIDDETFIMLLKFQKLTPEQKKILLTVAESLTKEETP